MPTLPHDVAALRTGANRSMGWTVAVLAMAAPLVILLCTTLWRMPYPISEAVGIFDDATRNEPTAFLTPHGPYFRPLFYVTMSEIWHHAGSTSNALAAVRLLHIVPIVALVLLFVWHLRPATALDAGAAVVAVSVLIGSPAFLANLELSISATILAIPLMLLTWMVMERDYRRWHGLVIVLLMVAAVALKEQGLVIVPLIVAAWWMGAPGVRGGAVAVAVVATVAYIYLRLHTSEGGWPPFEQSVGYGFTMLDTDAAQERFGAFPLWIYAYSSASTVANLLFSEPTDGVFRIVKDVAADNLQSWQVLYVLSSMGLTSLIAWWGVGSMRRADGEPWSPEARACAAVVLAVLASGALSFDYSRDRLGGTAVVFYALAAYFAVRAAAARALRASTLSWFATGGLLFLLAGAWQMRADYTLEYTRQRAVNNRREWLVNLQQRREAYVDRPVYRRIMEDMVAQGTAPDRLGRTQYPRWIYRVIGE